MRKLLYICVNDGSDMRVNREVRTLSREHEIVFLAIGEKSADSFVEEYCREAHYVPGSHKSPKTIARMIGRLISILSKNSFANVHVVDEQLYLAILPILVRSKVILDIFDSLFLKLNRPGERFWLLKRIMYSSVAQIIVTDENRADLLPRFVKSKTTVIPNVPCKIECSAKSHDIGPVSLCYFGSLLRNRGSEFISKLLDAEPSLRVLAAGWVRDAYTRTLLEHPHVEFLGVLRQEQINTILAKKGDY